MSRKYIFPLLFLLAGSLPALAQPPAKTPLPADTIMDTTLWVQTSAEYRAIAEEVYAVATEKLLAIAKRKYIRPIAVVVDVDETILDNSAFQVHQIQAWKGFNPIDWDEWISKRQAGAVPGAAEFLKTAAAHGIHVFYVTNRSCKPRESAPNEPCPQLDDTLTNLRSATGINSIAKDDVLLSGEQPDWTSEKASRRDYIEKKYSIEMLVGDQLSDFIEGTTNEPRDVRDKLESANAAHWGKDWFIIPNPMYGDYSNTDLLGTSKIGAMKGY